MDSKIISASLLLLVVTGLIFFSYGCSQQPVQVPDSRPVIPESPPSNYTPVPASSNTVVDANNQFGLDIYSRYKSNAGNLFFSPYSISSALAMTYEGAKGQTAEEMRAVLHLPNDTEKVRAEFAKLRDELNITDESYKLNTANALWAQSDYPFVDDYFRTVEEYYGGKATNLDFRTETENSRNTINSWVSDETTGRIKNLIPSGMLNPDTRLVLTNAIYFKANWSSQFDAENTIGGKFTLASGTAVEPKMMHQTNQFNYCETSELQILEMDYLGNDLSMLILLPKGNNLSRIEGALAQEKLNEWRNDLQVKKVIVVLPKFKFETKYFMAEDLKAMGMLSAFNYPGADFTGMSPTGELYIGQVIHQTFVEVAEYGTEAAAATAVIARAGSPPPTEEPKQFIADHPFIFIIQQKSTGTALFMGRVSDPTR